MGIPLRQCAKSQSNLVIPDLRGLTSDLARFSDMVLPLFWLQYVSFCCCCAAAYAIRMFGNSGSVHCCFFVCVCVVDAQELRELTTQITVTLIIVVNVLPLVQLCFTVLLFVSSALFVLLANMRYTNSPRFVVGSGRRRLSGRFAEEQCGEDVAAAGGCSGSNGSGACGGGGGGVGIARNRKLSIASATVVVKANGASNNCDAAVRQILVLGGQTEKSGSMRKNRV